MAHSKAVSTPTKNTTKSLKVRKSKSSKSKKVCTSAASVSKGKNRGKKIEEDEGSTGGLKLLKRHPVTMSKMTKGRVLKKRLRVQFDRNGSPVGKNAEKMQSYIGVLARTKIPISIASWPGVDKKKKNTLWETVLTAFILGPEHRKMVLQSAGAKWREFKSRLTTVYVLPYVDDPEMLQFPPDDYRFITVDEWTAFVTERTKPAFLVSCMFDIIYIIPTFVNAIVYRSAIQLNQM
ncbi:hypothetical protein RchiOBHm_Chr3g0462471 [Rosa chinensis]|uniref:Uncharacterized protein n=1 Tax=Rosa chinensis TaxID=74649 RepID=A0A2P6R8X0_ROSCH|nr:hypothetical protein RchiOBHm_Chr3g0462471 [Rosa chinensis]